MNNTSYLKDKRILLLAVIALALLVLDFHYGLNFGISFKGGVQIPIQLDKPVNSSTMTEMIGILESRASAFGLGEVKGEGVGSSEIYITIPKASNSTINKTISILDSEGIFEGVVNGKVAISGSGILKDTIGAVSPAVSGKNVEWEVTFSTTQAAADSFSKIAFGKSNYPLYMFLDRPSNSIIIINNSLLSNSTEGITSTEALTAMKNALVLGNDTIPVIGVVSNSNSSVSYAESFLNSTVSRSKYKTVFISENLNKSLIGYLGKLNYTIKLESNNNVTPTYAPVNTTVDKIVGNSFVISSWPMVGLISAPFLSPGVTNGNISTSYSINGPSPSNLPLSAKINYAKNESKTISSILSGGALPVGIVIGTPTTVPQSLGANSLEISFIALGIAIVSLSIFIAFRYKSLFLIAPILLTTFMELFIILSIIGLIGTIDLAAFAGIIAVVGTGVDAQIIITDEMVSNSGQTSNAKKLLGNAFYIVWMDAGLLIIAMLPLFFSTSLVTIIGFSEAAIIGVLMGILVTRPAYGAIISKHFS